MRLLPPLFVAIVLVCVCSASSARTVGRRVARATAKARTSVCDRFASTVGSDQRGWGTSRRPFRSLTRLDRSLRPGQTGCLMGGTYGGWGTWHQIDSDGTSDAQITIREAPGQVATVVGWVDMVASYTTLEDLRIDGANTLYASRPGTTCRDHVSQSLTISGHNDILQYVNYFQLIPALRGDGIGIGFWGDADDTIIRHDKIHDVGGCGFYDHLIYLASGNGTQIYDNWLWDDPHGWGIKLDPGPTGARIWGNVIDHAGSGFNFGNSSGTHPTADNRVFDNTVMNSVGVSNPDIHWSYPGVLVTSPGMLASSTGNYVWNNDSYDNPRGITDLARVVGRSQLSVSDNHRIEPHFKDAALHDYSLVSAAASKRRGRR